MAVQTSNTETREVGFLVDPEARYVSLVDRGANQIPFRIVKIQKMEGSHMKKVVHELIVPADVSEDDIRNVFSDETAPLLKFDKVREISKLKLFEQVDREKFDTSTFELVDIDRNRGIKAVVGQIKEDNRQGLIAKLFKTEPRQSDEVIAIPDDVTADEADRAEFIKMVLSPAVEDQLYVALANVAGILAQDGWEEKDRKKVISGILETLKDYLFKVLTISKSDALEITINDNKKEPTVEKQNEIIEKEQEVTEEVSPEVSAPEQDQVKDNNETEVVAKSNEADASNENKDEAVSTSSAELAEEFRKQVKELKDELSELREELKKMDELKKLLTASEAIYRPEAQGFSKQSAQKESSVFKGIFNL